LARLTCLDGFRIEAILRASTFNECAAAEHVKTGVFFIPLPAHLRITGFTAISNCEGMRCCDNGDVVAERNTILIIDVDNDEEAAKEFAIAIAEQALNAYETCRSQQSIRVNCIPIRRIVVTPAINTENQKPDA
jgi:hypothetical protein